MKNFLKEVANNSLGLAGLKIVRAARSRDLEPKEVPLTAGRNVELIGPPGAGKTTTTDLLRQGVKDLWNLRSDLDLLSVGDSSQRFDYTRKNIFFRRMENLEADHDSFRAINFSLYLSKIIMNDIKITHGDVRAGVLLDEGICQVCKKEILELSDDDFFRLVNGRAIVFLSPRDPDVVVEQYKRRMMEAVPQRIPEPDSIIRDKIVWSIDMCERLMKRLERADVRTLSLTVEDGTKNNARVLEKFLASL